MPDELVNWPFNLLPVCYFKIDESRNRCFAAQSGLMARVNQRWASLYDKYVHELRYMQNNLNHSTTLTLHGPREDLKSQVQIHQSIPPVIMATEVRVELNIMVFFVSHIKATGGKWLQLYHLWSHRWSTCLMPDEWTHWTICVGERAVISMGDRKL